MVQLSKKALLATVSLSLLAASAELGHAGAPSGNAVMDKVEARYQGKDMLATVNLEIVPKHGVKRLRRFVVMRKQYAKAIKLVTFFLAPTDVRNAAFLVWDNHGSADRRWLYLPAISQVRRIAASDERQSFFGSDFVYEDLTNRDPEQDTHKLVGQQKVDGRECWVVDSVPKDKGSVDFVRYRSWVWKTSPIVIRQAFYNSKGKMIRLGQVRSLKKVQGIWTYYQGTMKNLKTGSQSRLEFRNIRYNTGVPEARFSETQLNRGAPKP